MQRNSLRMGGFEDGKKLLAIFPEEIWLTIINLLADPNDHVTFAQASPFWADLLKPKRQQYLFPKVLNILLEQNLITTESRHDLLPCRPVCRFWKFGVERLLETMSHYKNITLNGCRHAVDKDLSFPTYFWPSRRHMQPKLETEIIPRLSSSISHEWNPFPSRNFYIYEILGWEDNKYEILNRLRCNVGRILQLAGHHIWYAYIGIGTQMKTGEWYTMLCRYVGLLPNLKCLYVKCLSLSCRDWIGDANVPPFPTVRSLDLLSIESTPYPVMNAMFQANPHVKFLIIPDALPSHCDRGLPSDRQTHQLDFSLIQNPERVAIKFSSLEDLSRLPTEEWNMKVLRMGFYYRFGCDWNPIFDKLGNANTTLTELFIEFPRAMNSEDKLRILMVSRTKLWLPNVKKLEAKIKNYCSLDFLLGLESLEHLYLTMIHDDTVIDDAAEDVINYNNGFFDRIPECNIWELIPTLSTIIFNRFRKGKETFVRPSA